MTAPAAGGSRAPLGLIAGGGGLPLEILADLKRRGEPVVPIAIKDETLPQFRAEALHELGWGQIGQLFKVLHAAGCDRVILIGSVTRRPDFTSILGDLGTMRRLPAILKAMVGGDDSLLTRVIRIFEAENLTVVGVADVAPGLLAPTGPMGEAMPAGDQITDMQLASRAVRRLGELDIGQAAVAVGGRVIALEGAEGTDAMLQRCAELRANGRVRVKGMAGVLVKAAKPGQDLRVDLPTIGPRTIELARAAGLAGIAVEAGRALVAERETTLAAARQAGLFLHGLAPLAELETDT
ncbi:LpxI family protein [Pannonibacter tanglangensis]|uniref:UDP-2,3-diacylglucosamine diphosphatase LpxI n=1 Tax=Pannonibacter tanglangensis TaxID=2750084 RepID=A0ABW9ZBU9_9HYPH|nr:UDP-2,3-diacylglucosamine diphosphatase LpxI [Pannonibacter sp. XCT-34]NBN62303.1 UDP-2,3-diacylglucosamine diphosphatase LpxI [Pannonibacter sp. XCT-34]